MLLAPCAAATLEAVSARYPLLIGSAMSRLCQLLGPQERQDFRTPRLVRIAAAVPLSLDVGTLEAAAQASSAAARLCVLALKGHAADAGAAHLFR